MWRRGNAGRASTPYLLTFFFFMSFPEAIRIIMAPATVVAASCFFRLASIVIGEAQAFSFNVFLAVLAPVCHHEQDRKIMESSEQFVSASLNWSSRVHCSTNAELWWLETCCWSGQRP